jgi:hypothetical protein
MVSARWRLICGMGVALGGALPFGPGNEEVLENIFAITRGQRVSTDFAVKWTVGGSRTWPYAHQLVARPTLRTGEVFGTTFGHDTAHPLDLSRHCPRNPHVNAPPHDRCVRFSRPRPTLQG